MSKVLCPRCNSSSELVYKTWKKLYLEDQGEGIGEFFAFKCKNCGSCFWKLNHFFPGATPKELGLKEEEVERLWASVW